MSLQASDYYPVIEHFLSQENVSKYKPIFQAIIDEAIATVRLKPISIANQQRLMRAQISVFDPELVGELITWLDNVEDFYGQPKATLTVEMCSVLKNNGLCFLDKHADEITPLTQQTLNRPIGA